MRDLARDFCVEFESSRRRAIFEISSRTVEKNYREREVTVKNMTRFKRTKTKARYW